MNSTSKIEKLKGFKNDPLIIEQIKEIIKPSYKIAGAHLFHDLDSCDQLYFIKDDQQILAFFMVGYQTIANRTVCYLGLSACRKEYKNSGLTKSLYKQWANDCQEEQLKTGERILWYGTTASPIVYHWLTNNFFDVNPKRDGSCSPSMLESIRSIARHKYPDANFLKDIPFVLRHAAHEINYSDEERARLKEAVTRLNLSVFDKYQLDELNGDRFLMVGYCSP